MKDLFLRMRGRVFRVAAKSPWLAGPPFVFNQAFCREAWSVANGAVLSQSHAPADFGWRYSLRAIIHVIEKALSASNRKEIFGLSYVNRAVNDYGRLAAYYLESPCESDLRLLLWGHGVLTEYFTALEHVDGLKSHSQQFEKIDASIKAMIGNHHRNKPYLRDSVVLPSYQDMMTLARHRRSVRNFLVKPVPHDLLIQAVDIAALSPSRHVGSLPVIALTTTAPPCKPMGCARH